MTFLPIVERELRVAARKRSTFWVRIVAAIFALLIGLGFLLISRVSGFLFGNLGLGGAMFATLTWLSFAAVLAAGLFLTSDCLSEEKREGTLGFLFLTDLRGHDVVSGKLLATSLQGFYALLAVLPILAISFVLGGVTAAQFWKTSLALVNALFVSLAAGLFISALSRESQKAMFATLALLALIAGGGPAADALWAETTGHVFFPALSLTSPVYLFLSAGGSTAASFSTSLLVNQLLAWLLFGLACFLIPRTWQERVGKNSGSTRSRTQVWNFGSPRRRAALRAKLMDRNPVLWLGCRERWTAAALWLCSLLLLAGFSSILWLIRDDMGWMVWGWVGGLFTLLLYLGTTVQAVRFFFEARRSGLLEMLLSTPITDREIIRGHWLALLRLFGLPLLICLAVFLGGNFLSQRQTYRMMAQVATAMPPGPAATNATVVTTNSVSGSVSYTSTSPASLAPVARDTILPLIMAVAVTLSTLANLAALVWFGMWAALGARSANLATLRTLLFVQIIPWFVISFASAMVVPLVLIPSLVKGGAPNATFFTWYPLLTAGVGVLLSLGKDAFFIVWSRRALRKNFRARASQNPPLHSAAPAPPAKPPGPPSALPPVLVAS